MSHLCLSPATTGVKGTSAGWRAPLSLETGPCPGKGSAAPPGRQVPEALVSRGPLPGRGSRALLAPQVPAPSLSSLALSAPSVLPALGCPPVLPEVEVAASARCPLLLPCVYRVRTGPRPGRSRLLSASCRPGRALRFCSKHGRRRGVCAPDIPAGCLCLSLHKAEQGGAPGRPPCPQPWAGCPQEPLG